ncbi:MAG: hypothetical protein DI562_02445 [Stenotrophomonas acidaminiphila]|nr:MAG: hypothetical protein DI562_02445 [Stenotrophomonas acidaminiphila]
MVTCPPCRSTTCWTRFRLRPTPVRRGRIRWNGPDQRTDLPRNLGFHQADPALVDVDPVRFVRDPRDARERTPDDEGDEGEQHEDGNDQDVGGHDQSERQLGHLAMRQHGEIACRPSLVPDDDLQSLRLRLRLLSHV